MAKLKFNFTNPIRMMFTAFPSKGEDAKLDFSASVLSPKDKGQPAKDSHPPLEGLFYISLLVFSTFIEQIKTEDVDPEVKSLALKIQDDITKHRNKNEKVMERLRKMFVS